MEEVLLLPFSLLPLWRSWRWGLRYTLYYMRLVAGPSACIYIAVAGMILGYVAQDFVFRYLPFRQFTEPLLTENLLNATGFSLFRFLVPILSTILIAARSGAAVSADVGSKVYGNQLDAMKTIGMNPVRALRTPILYAFLLGTPFLALLSYSVAALTAAFAFLISHQNLGIAFWDAHFHKELVQPASILYRGKRMADCETRLLRTWCRHDFVALRSGTKIVGCRNQPRRDAHDSVGNAFCAVRALCVFIV